MYETEFLTAFFHSFLITMIMTLSELGFFSILSYFIPDFYNNKTYFQNVIALTIPSKLLYFALLQYISQYIKKKKTRELASDKKHPLPQYNPDIIRVYCYCSCYRLYVCSLTIVPEHYDNN